MKFCILFFYLTLFASITFVAQGCGETEQNVSGYGTVVRFQVNVKTDLNESGKYNIEKDWCVLMLPENSGQRKSIPLVIYCHSGGGTVDSVSSEAENIDFTRYFVSQGWAVLCTAGMPESYSARLRLDHNRCLGSPVSVRSVQKAYDYISNHYEIIDSDSCMLFCNSNGGLTASSVVNLTSIPVIAQSGLCPLISIEKNVWEGLGYKTGLIRMFGMKSNTYEKDKVGKYDPYDYNTKSQTPYKCPYLIIQPQGDHFVSYDIAVEFAKIMNAKGSDITVMNTDEVGGHNVIPQPEIVGDYNYMGKKYQLNKTVRDVYLFFCKYRMSSNGK